MSSVPDGAIEPEKAAEEIIEGGSQDERERAIEIANISTSKISGKKVVGKFLTRETSTSTQTYSFPEVFGADSVDLSTISEIDEEEINKIIDKALGEPQSIEEIDEGPPTSFEEADYSGVITQTTKPCWRCDGSGRGCNKCSGRGSVECPRCTSGTVKHYCGCRDTETHRGYRGRVKAGRGQVLRKCDRCGGDGSRNVGSKVNECQACNGQGAFSETCQNCGGDGVSRREQCARCEGTGDLTCSRCDGAGDVDYCNKCEGVGFRVNQEVQHINYGTQEKSALDGADVICDNADNVSWEKTKTQMVDTDFDDLPVDPPSEGDVVRAELTEFESPDTYKVRTEFPGKKNGVRFVRVVYFQNDRVIEKNDPVDIDRKQVVPDSTATKLSRTIGQGVGGFFLGSIVGYFIIFSFALSPGGTLASSTGTLLTLFVWGGITYRCVNNSFTKVAKEVAIGLAGMLIALLIVGVLLALFGAVFDIPSPVVAAVLLIITVPFVYKFFYPGQILMDSDGSDPSDGGVSGLT